MTLATIATLVTILAGLVNAEYAVARLAVLARANGGIEGLAHDLIADVQGHATPDRLAALHPDIAAQAALYLTAAPVKAAP